MGCICSAFSRFAVAFVCLVSTLLIVVNVNGVRDRWGETVALRLTWGAVANQEQIAAIEKALLATDGVTEVRFVSSEDARRECSPERRRSDRRLTAEAFPPRSKWR